MTVYFIRSRLPCCRACSSGGSDRSVSSVFRGLITNRTADRFSQTTAQEARVAFDKEYRLALIAALAYMMRQSGNNETDYGEHLWVPNTQVNRHRNADI